MKKYILDVDKHRARYYEFYTDQKWGDRKNYDICVNTTNEDIKKIAEWIHPAKKYFLQNFIDSGDLIKNNLSAHNRETLEFMRYIAQDTIPNTQIRGI